MVSMKLNSTYNAMRSLMRRIIGAGLCLAAIACSKESKELPEPQDGIIPTKVVFDITRNSNYGEPDTRAPKSEWKEGDVIYFGRYLYNFTQRATYTGGQWIMTGDIITWSSGTTLTAFYAENGTLSSSSLVDTEHGDAAYTFVGVYKIDSDGIATVRLTLNKHPHARIIFTGVGVGKTLTVYNFKRLQSFCRDKTISYKSEPITITGDSDGNAVLYALPTDYAVTGKDLTMIVNYEGESYSRTFVGKSLAAGKSVTVTSPGNDKTNWENATKVYTASDLKMGDYYYSDGTTSDGGLRKMNPACTYEEEDVAPVSGKTVIGIVMYAGRHPLDDSDYTKALIESGPVINDAVKGYVLSLTHSNNGEGDRLAWEKGPNGENDVAVGTSTDSKDWRGYSNCRKIHDYVNATDGWEMYHFPMALSCETYGQRIYDGNGNIVSDGRYDWQTPLKAPSNGNSGWFMPSAGQLSHIYLWRSYFEERFETVKATLDSSVPYKRHIMVTQYGWSLESSSEYPGNSLVWYVNFDFGGIFDKVAKVREANARAILVF